MKLKYYKHHTEVLHRNTRKRKKKIKKIKKQLFISFIRLLLLCFVISISAFFIYKFINGKTFIIKEIQIITKNNNEIISSEYFDFLKGKNIFNINIESIKDSLNKYYPDYSLFAINKLYPSKINCIIYKKIPVITINGNYVIYQDMSLKKYKYSTNTINLHTEIKNYKSIFDIPGLASAFESILANRKMIKSIRIENEKWIIKTNNNMNLIIQAGMEIPDISKIYNSNYKTLDYRFRKMIIVKK